MEIQREPRIKSNENTTLHSVETETLHHRAQMETANKEDMRRGVACRKLAGDLVDVAVGNRAKKEGGQPARTVVNLILDSTDQ